MITTFQSFPVANSGVSSQNPYEVEKVNYDLYGKLNSNVLICRDLRNPLNDLIHLLPDEPQSMHQLREVVKEVQHIVDKLNTLADVRVKNILGSVYTLVFDLIRKSKAYLDQDASNSVFDSKREYGMVTESLKERLNELKLVYEREIEPLERRFDEVDKDFHPYRINTGMNPDHLLEQSSKFETAMINLKKACRDAENQKLGVEKDIEILKEESARLKDDLDRQEHLLKETHDKIEDIRRECSKLVCASDDSSSCSNSQYKKIIDLQQHQTHILNERHLLEREKVSNIIQKLEIECLLSGDQEKCGKQPKKPRTHFKVSIDKSGSIKTNWIKILESYKSLMTFLKVNYPDCLVTVLFFDSKTYVWYNSKPISEVPDEIPIADTWIKYVTGVIRTLGISHEQEMFIPSGGTSFDQVFVRTAELVRSNPKDILFEFFLTDGQANVQPSIRVLQNIHSSTNNYRLFPIVVGGGSESQMSELASAANGNSQFEIPKFDSSGSIKDGEKETLFNYVTTEKDLSTIGTEIFSKIIDSYFQATETFKVQLIKCKEILKLMEERQMQEMESVRKGGECAASVISGIQITIRKEKERVLEEKRAIELKRLKDTEDELKRYQTDLAVLNDEIIKREREIVKKEQEKNTLIFEMKEFEEQLKETKEQMDNTKLQQGDIEKKLREYNLCSIRDMDKLAKLMIHGTVNKPKIRETVQGISELVRTAQIGISGLLNDIKGISGATSIEYEIILRSLVVLFNKFSEEDKRKLPFEGNWWEFEHKILMLWGVKYNFDSETMTIIDVYVINTVGLAIALDQTREEKELIQYICKKAEEKYLSPVKMMESELNKLVTELSEIENNIVLAHFLLNNGNSQDFNKEVNKLETKIKRNEEELDDEAGKLRTPGIDRDEREEVNENIERLRKKKEKLEKELKRESDLATMKARAVQTNTKTEEELKGLVLELEEHKKEKILDRKKIEYEIERIVIGKDNLLIQIENVLIKLRTYVFQDLRKVRRDEIERMMRNMIESAFLSLIGPIRCYLENVTYINPTEGVQMVLG